VRPPRARAVYCTPDAAPPAAGTGSAPAARPPCRSWPPGTAPPASPASTASSAMHMASLALNVSSALHQATHRRRRLATKCDQLRAATRTQPHTIDAGVWLGETVSCERHRAHTWESMRVRTPRSMPSTLLPHPAAPRVAPMRRTSTAHHAWHPEHLCHTLPHPGC